MADMSKATEARSDQINYVDIGHDGLKEIKVVSAHLVDDGKGGAKSVIHYEGDNGRPYKPCKGMDRLIQSKYAWGSDSDDWIGKSILLIGNKDVIWAGSAHGGIQIKALSHIGKNGFSEFVAMNGKKRRLYKVEYLEPTTAEAVQDVITADDQLWIDAVRLNPEVLETIVDEDYRARIEKLAV